MEVLSFLDAKDSVYHWMLSSIAKSEELQCTEKFVEWIVLDNLH